MSKAFALRFLATTVLAPLTNPFLFVQFVLLNFGQLWVRFRERGRTAGLPTALRYSLPVDGEWLVVNGGVTADTSHSWDMPNQRYAYDILKPTDIPMGTGQSGDRDLISFGTFGQPVLAPADGTVVCVRDGQRDYRSAGTGAVDMWCRDIRGNHILIQHRQDEFSLLAHLRKDTVAVTAGERVRRGQKIGECGNSGHSTQPHLHFHIQDRRSFNTALSRIIVWDRVCRNGEVAASCADLSRGDRVADASTSGKPLSGA